MPLNCWRRLLRVPWTERRSNQSILKISPGISLEGMMLQLKLQYFGHLMSRVDSLEKTLMLGKVEGGGEGDDRGWDSWMASPTQWTWVWVTLGVGDGQGGLACCDSWDRKQLDTTERLTWSDHIDWFAYIEPPCNLGWIQFHNGIWSFFSSVRFGLLIFCSGFLCCCLSVMLAYNFLFW